MKHPDFYVLDEYALGIPHPEIAEHLSSCLVCRRHIEQVKSPGPMPTWAEDIAPARRQRGWPYAVATLAMAAAVLLAVLFAGTPDPDPYVGIKGQPVVVVYLKRAGEVTEWERGNPVRPGDSLRLGVVGNGFEHVAVYDPIHLIYTGELQAGENLLDRSWKLEGTGRDSLRVVLSHEPATRDFTPELTWEETLDFDKETP